LKAPAAKKPNHCDETVLLLVAPAVMSSCNVQISPYNGAHLRPEQYQGRDQVPADPEEITLLLRHWRDGDSEAESRLFTLLYPQLKKIAQRYLYRERRNHTLQRTELVAEIFPGLRRSRGTDWQHRGHFLAIASRMMRHYLIDYARRRPKIELLPIEGLPESFIAGRKRVEIIVAIDALVDELEQLQPEVAQVLVHRWYLGLTTEETAESLCLNERKVERHFHEAKKWLYERLSKQPCKAAQKTTTG
jgi:RNA polymerase sigma factor (TIGR02999 family)